MHHIFIHSSADRRLSYVHVLATVKNAVVNTGVHVSLELWLYFS